MNPSPFQQQAALLRQSALSYRAKNPQREAVPLTFEQLEKVARNIYQQKYRKRKKRHG